MTCQAAAAAVQYASAAPAAAPAAPQLGPPAPLSCELLQGNLARFSDASKREVPTAVLVHGILGSRRNLQSFARMIVEVRMAPHGPAWARMQPIDAACAQACPQAPHAAAPR